MSKRGLMIALVLLAAALVAAQDKPAGQPPPQSGMAKTPLSPRGQAAFAFADGKKVTVDYGRPYIRGRKIMGGLVPYGEVWRIGANAATSFVSEADLMFAGARVPAGKYTLYTVPGEQSWTVVVNKQTGQWGTVYNQAQDLVRVQVKPTKLPSPVDQFTISFQKQGTNGGRINLDWENTSVPIDFSEASR